MPGSIALSFLNVGQAGFVDRVMGTDSVCKKLMEMGINKGALVKIIKNDLGPMIVRLGESQIILSKSLAQKVIIKEA